MKNLKLLYLILTLTVVISSCKKDDPAPPTKTELLTNKPWKITGITVNKPLAIDTNSVSGGYIYTQDIYTYYGANGLSCFNDNIRKFSKSPASFTFEQGAVACGATGLKVYNSGNWTFSSDESSIAFSGSTPSSSTEDSYYDFVTLYGITSLNVVELTGTSLKLTYTLGTYTFTETLSNQ